MIPLRVDPFFWVLAGLLGWLNGGGPLEALLWVVIILVSVLIHELGHALTALVFGQKASIALTAFGGLTTRTGHRLSNWKEFLVILNGPLAGLGLYFLCGALLGSPLAGNKIAHYVLAAGMVANLFWTILNLIPVQPLDGGQLLTVSLKALFGLTGAKIAQWLSLLFAIGIAVFFLIAGQLLIGSIFLLFAFENYRAARAYQLASPEDEREELREKLMKANDFESGGKEDEALRLYEEIAKEAPAGIIHYNAALQSAKILYDQACFKEAYDQLHPLREFLEGGDLKLLQFCAYETHRYEEALKIGEQLHQEEADEDVADINAKCAEKLGRLVEAKGWQETAKRESE